MFDLTQDPPEQRNLLHPQLDNLKPEAPPSSTSYSLESIHTVE